MVHAMNEACHPVDLIDSSTQTAAKALDIVGMGELIRSTF
jgi:hypothetical protein